MKEAKEYLDGFVNDHYKENYSQSYAALINIIRQAQKDAYNQAIDDAAECASVEYKKDYLTGEIDKESILKLKK